MSEGGYLESTHGLIHLQSLGCGVIRSWPSHTVTDLFTDKETEARGSLN